MEATKIEKEFKDKTCQEIRLFPEGSDRFRVFTPFMLDDGDHLSIVLKSEKGRWMLSDEGITYMHLSVLGTKEESLLYGRRQEIITGTLREFGVEDRDGELLLQINDEQYGEALYSFVQSLLRISNITYLNKENNKVPFLQEFKNLIVEAVPQERCEFNWYNKDLDASAKYTVDCRINSMARPLMIFAIPSDRAALASTVAIYQFDKWKIPFFPIGIFKEMEKVAPKTVAKFSDVCEKIYSNIEDEENRDSIIRYLQSKINAN